MIILANIVFAYLPNKIALLRRRIIPNMKSKMCRFTSSSATTSSLETIAASEQTLKADSSDGSNNKFVKRKVAMVFSYVGSKYNGLQFNPILEFITIESEIQKALFAVGCIKLTNLNGSSFLLKNTEY